MSPLPPHQDALADPLVRQMMSLLMAQSRDHAFVLLNPDAVIVAWLGNSETIFGYTSEEAIGQSISLIFTPEDLEKDLDHYEQKVALANGHSEDDRWHLRKDGTRIWVTGTMNLLSDGAGNAVGLMKIMRDRTDLRSRLETLENRVLSLQESQARAERYLNTLGHELRNPVGVISNSAQLLCHALADEKQLKPVHIIQRQITLLERFSEDLVDVSRMKLNRLELHLEPVHLQPLLADLAFAVQPRAQAKGLRLEVIQASAPIVVTADPARLQQVVLNLLDNAVKYTPAGGTIWVKTTEEVSDAVIRVEDNGMGISADILPRIFELFTQGPGAHEQSPDGLGIGLALVRELVELHQGEVLVRSSGPGKGSQFTVRLPLDSERVEAGVL
jgi:PAS domain S-box-containing protein